MADPDVSCPVCAAMYRPETPPDGHETPAPTVPAVVHHAGSDEPAERRTAE